jgi:ribose transport system permease protein
VLSLLVLASFLGIASAGQTFAILLGGIDLSVPFVMGAGNVIGSQLSGGNNWPFWAVALFIALLALLVGAANGYISHRFDIHPLIVTLGVGSMVAGGVLVWTQARLTGSAPTWLGTFTSPAATTGFIPLPPVVVFWLVFSAVVFLLLHRTAVGRWVYGTGANPLAARLALIPTRWVWTGTFAASALCAAVAGVLLAGFSGSGEFDIGTPYLFTTIASVIVGGTSLLGARGDYLRTILGVLILTQITTLLLGFGFDAALQQAILGVAIVAVVATYAREPSIRTRI